MADSNTTTYSFTLPEVGASADSWGTKLNANWDKVDDLLDGSIAVNGITVTGGSIDGTPVGATTPSTGEFTTVTTTGNVDVTGTLSADGLTSDGNINITGGDNRLDLFNGSGQYSLSRTSTTVELSSGGSVQFKSGATGKMRLSPNGDVLFYEDTGTTAKMVWSSSAESLGINEASPGSNAAFGGGVKLQTADDTNTGYTTTGSGKLPYGTQLSTYNIAASSSSLSGIGLLNRGPGGASMGSYIGSLGASSGWGSSIVFGMTSGSSSYTERMRIDSSGNVGIGTASPSAHLDIEGITPVIRLTGNGNNTANFNYGEIQFYNLDTSGAGAQIGASIHCETASSTGARGQLVFSTNDASGVEGEDASEAMRIDSSGNLFIGTTTGSGKVNVDGDITAGSAVTAKYQTGGDAFARTRYLILGEVNTPAPIMANMKIICSSYTHGFIGDFNFYKPFQSATMSTSATAVEKLGSITLKLSKVTYNSTQYFALSTSGTNSQHFAVSGIFRPNIIKPFALSSDVHTVTENAVLHTY